MKYAKILLTEEQRKEFVEISAHISDLEIARYYTLNQQDITLINQNRRDYNRVGFALQICHIRHLGSICNDINNIPNSIICHICNQLNIQKFDSLKEYGIRRATKSTHIQTIKEVYQYISFEECNDSKLREYLMEYAMENDNQLRLMRLAINYLRNNKILVPGITSVEKIIIEIIQESEYKIYEVINQFISNKQRQLLNDLIESTGATSITTLAYLKEEPGQSSPTTFLSTIDRLDKIRKLNLELDISMIHPNRFKQLSRLGSKYEPYAFRRFDESKRYALLAAFLYDLSERLVDFAVEIHDKQINTLFSKGRKQQEEIQKHNGKALNEKINQYVDIGTALIKSRLEGTDPYQALESIMAWNKLVESVEDARKLSRPKNYDYIDLLSTKYNYLRKYTPSLVKHLRFYTSNVVMYPLIEAIELIKELNDTGKRIMPDHAPLDFISNRWTKYLYNGDGTINRRYYEIATLTELRNRIRSGDVAVEGSRNYRSFDEYIISKEEWVVSQTESKLSVSNSVEEYLNERLHSLNLVIDSFKKNMNRLEGANIVNNKIRVEKLDRDTPELAELLSEKLYDMLPRIKLPELLLEVSHWSQFDKYFTHASSNHSVNSKEKAIVMATLMGMGTNIGLLKMSESTPGISYYQMANTSQWRMYEDAMKKAQACLVNYQHQCQLPLFWGDGTTSSSDGMRVQIGVSALNSEFNPHYGSKQGATMYRFTSDQYTTFWVNIISSNARDALHIIDGINYHETDLCIGEHYTDTAGYTDQIFGLCHLLGFRFAPRIRDITDLQLFSISKQEGILKEIIQGKINVNCIRENYDEVLRLAHSIREGRVSGSLIMSKLGSYARQNSLATALREMGRIEKTIFILEYIMDKSLRRRIHRGLNKGEAMNALARAIFFGKRGELREKELQDQLQRASALNILINAICVWNTKYLEKAIEHLKTQENFDEELLKHISPLNWAHINFLGEYSFDGYGMPKENEMRDLNIKM